MNKLSRIAMAAALAGASVSASAWWGPFNSWGNDGFGDGWFDFNVSAHAHGRGHGWNRYHDYYGPYAYGPWAAPYGPYGPGALPVYAMTEAQQSVLQEQHKAMAEQQQKALQQAVETQRKLAEQFAAQQAKVAEQLQEQGFDPMRMDPLASDNLFAAESPALEDLPGMPLPEHVKKALEQSKTRRDAAIKEMQARRDERVKEFEERRKEIFGEDAMPWASAGPQNKVM
jgi:hypothetical protein